MVLISFLHSTRCSREKVQGPAMRLKRLCNLDASHMFQSHPSLLPNSSRRTSLSILSVTCSGKPCASAFAHADALSWTRGRITEGLALTDNVCLSKLLLYASHAKWGIWSTLWGCCRLNEIERTNPALHPGQTSTQRVLGAINKKTVHLFCTIQTLVFFRLSSNSASSRKPSLPQSTFTFPSLWILTTLVTPQELVVTWTWTVNIHFLF